MADTYDPYQFAKELGLSSSVPSDSARRTGSEYYGPAQQTAQFSDADWTSPTDKLGESKTQYTRSSQFVGNENPLKPDASHKRGRLMAEDSPEYQDLYVPGEMTYSFQPATQSRLDQRLKSGAEAAGAKDVFDWWNGLSEDDIVKWAQGESDEDAQLSALAFWNKYGNDEAYADFWGDNGFSRLWTIDGGLDEQALRELWKLAHQNGRTLQDYADTDWMDLFDDNMAMAPELAKYLMRLGYGDYSNLESFEGASIADIIPYINQNWDSFKDTDDYNAVLDSVYKMLVNNLQGDHVPTYGEIAASFDYDYPSVADSIDQRPIPGLGYDNWDWELYKEAWQHDDPWGWLEEHVPVIDNQLPELGDPAKALEESMDGVVVIPGAGGKTVEGVK